MMAVNLFCGFLLGIIFSKIGFVRMVVFIISIALCVASSIVVGLFVIQNNMLQFINAVHVFGVLAGFAICAGITIPLCSNEIKILGLTF